MTRSRAIGMLAGVVAVVAAGLMLDVRVGPQESRAAKDKAARAHWFISPTGTDVETGGQGTDPSIPWRTINYALNTATGPIAGDTMFCLTGTWVAPDAPSECRIRSTLQGDRDFPTVITSYRDGDPEFDGTGYEGLNKGAFFFQNRGGVRFKDIGFLNYFDEDTTNNSSTAIIYQENNTAAVDTVLGVDVLSCTFTVDDRGSMGTKGRSRMAIRMRSFSSTDPAVDVIDQPFIENNVIRRMGDHAIVLGYTPNAAIQNNWIFSRLEWNANPVDGPDALVCERMASGVTVTRNTFSGFDHGMNVRGHGWQIRENWFFDLNDDAVFFFDDASTDNVVDQNVAWRIGDDAFDLRGSGTCKRNTAYRWNNAGFAFSSAATGPWEVFDNIMVDACVCNPNESVQLPRYVVIQAEVAGGDLNFDYNVYFDPQGALFTDSRPGGVGSNGTFAQWQAFGEDANSFEQNPLFVDSLAANFSPLKAGPAVGASRYGGTIGGNPCADCLWWAISTTTGIDSVRVVTVAPDRSVQSAIWNGGVFAFGNTFVFDDPITTPASTEYQQIGAHWTLHTDAKDSPQTAEDLVIVPPDVDYSVLADSVWNQTAADYRRRNIHSTDSLLTGGGGTVDYSVMADSVWNPTSAAHRWRTIHRADSTAWNQGSGAFLGDIVTRDAGTFGRVPYASVRVFADPTRLLAIGNLTTAPNGTRGYAYEPNQTYYFTGWASGYQTTDVQYKPQSDGFVFNIDLNSIDVPITTNPQLCTVTISTVDFQGVPTDSILVEANFDGQGANTGDLILSYSSVDCTTDSGGFCGVDLVRSSEISTPDRIKTYTFTMTDTRQPVQFTPITFRGITIPDQANANLADLLP